MPQTNKIGCVVTVPKILYNPIVKGILYALGIALINLFIWMGCAVVQNDRSIRIMQAGMVQHEKAYEREFSLIHDQFATMQQSIGGIREDLKLIIKREEIADASR